MAEGVHLYARKNDREIMEKEAQDNEVSLSGYFRVLAAIFRTPAQGDDEMRVVRERVRQSIQEAIAHERNR